MSTLPKILPIFPLGGALLLPSGNLPLNIFEPRYISLVDYALSKEKLIGMVQPKEDDTGSLYLKGCVGKITNFSETNDHRYLINLNGISRFTILSEATSKYKFRIFTVKYDNSKSNFNKFDKRLFNKQLFINKTKLYLKNKGLTVNWEAFQKIEDKSLIITISMICPFNISEKQMLLETKNINSLADTSLALFNFEINQKFNHETIN